MNKKKIGVRLWWLSDIWDFRFVGPLSVDEMKKKIIKESSQPKHSNIIWQLAL